VTIHTYHIQKNYNLKNWYERVIGDVTKDDNTLSNKFWDKNYKLRWIKLWNKFIRISISWIYWCENTKKLHIQHLRRKLWLWKNDIILEVNKWFEFVILVFTEWKYSIKSLETKEVIESLHATNNNLKRCKDIIGSEYVESNIFLKKWFTREVNKNTHDKKEKLFYNCWIWCNIWWLRQWNRLLLEESIVWIYDISSLSNPIITKFLSDVLSFWEYDLVLETENDFVLLKSIEWWYLIERKSIKNVIEQISNNHYNKHGTNLNNNRWAKKIPNDYFQYTWLFRLWNDYLRTNSTMVYEKVVR